jgi:hypothetical protein
MTVPDALDHLEGWEREERTWQAAVGEPGAYARWQELRAAMGTKD